MPYNPANISTFPYAIPIGVLLLVLSFRNQKKNLSSFVSPLVPYATRQNYAISLLSLFEYPYLFMATWVAMWIPLLIEAFVLAKH